MYWSNPYDSYMGQHMMNEGGGLQVSRKEDRIFSEDILEKNIGQTVTAYMTFEGSNAWRDRIFTGRLLAVGRDFFVLREYPEQDTLSHNPSNPQSGSGHQVPQDQERYIPQNPESGHQVPAQGQDRLLYNINLDYFVFHNHIKK